LNRNQRLAEGERLADERIAVIPLDEGGKRGWMVSNVC
jgi:hypothetical protein